MKRVICLLAFLIPVAAFVGCNNKNKTRTASDSAREYAEYLRDRNYDRFADYIIYEVDLEPVSATAGTNDNVRRENTRRHSQMVRNTVDPYVNSKGGIRDVSVVSENKSKDGKSANVVVRNQYNNGQTEDHTYDMMLVNNEWKVKMGPNREVWKTRLPDGTHVGFKLKDSDDRDIYKEHIGDERDFVKVIDGDDRHVIKVKEDGEKEVLKVKEKDDEIVIKHKEDGEKTVTRIPKE